MKLLSFIRDVAWAGSLLLLVSVPVSFYRPYGGEPDGGTALLGFLGMLFLYGTGLAADQKIRRTNHKL